ncbi:MAG: DNA-binding protein [Desulfobacteraceae bacterium]|nr:MAG: DNA-binding protein [Desulfobacteraceae bacterium]
MKYCQAAQGRTFILRLEDGDVVHETIEAFARAQSIQSAALIILGGADTGSRLVTGPEKGRPKQDQTEKIIPMTHTLDDVHEVSGTGTLFPDAAGNPVLHMHMSCGRNGHTVTGCVRTGVKVWHVMEVVLFELIGNDARRLRDSSTGFDLLTP